MNEREPDMAAYRSLKQAAIWVVVLLFIGVSGYVTWRYVISPSGHKADTAAGTSGVAPKILFYRNPMDPTITSPVPAKDYMGMDYIPVYAEGTAPKTKTPEEEADAFFAEETGDLPKTVKGLAPITLSGQAIQVAGVVTTPAVREPFQIVIRTVGRVIPDETREHRVQTKIEGWVEKLFVNFTGQAVRQGDPVLSLYSPTLVSSQEAYLQAVKTASQLMAASDPEIKKSGELLLKAARGRLELFDVPEAFINELMKTGSVQRSVLLRSPATGFVTEKQVLEGQQVTPGMALFTVADLSTIWVEAEFYEYEAAAIKIGLAARLTAPFDPKLHLEGKLSFVYPYLNPESRTLKARLEFPNEGLALKPGMFVDIDLLLDLGDSVVIPDSAVMDSGTRKVVFVQTAEGTFTPREIRCGAISRGKAQVLVGIEAGENVVTRANFLLDSESRLQAIINDAMPGGSQP